MRLALVIDHLGVGGAQRQLLLLGKVLASRGVDVRYLTYHARRDLLPEDGGETHDLELLSGVRVQRALRLRAALRRFSPDGVLAFLEGPSLYSELARLAGGSWPLVVSERGTPERTLASRLRLACHRLADAIVVNSDDTRRRVFELCPRLRERVVRIDNAVDLDLFRPRGVRHATGPTRVCVLARYSPEKNVGAVIDALEILRRERTTARVRVDWYGSVSDRAVLEEARSRVTAAGLSEVFGLHGPVDDVRRVLDASDALLLPSLSESSSNAMAEAMATGTPVLASNLGMARDLLPEAGGLMFDPSAPHELARALCDLANLAPSALTEIAAQSRAVAERRFSPDRAAEEYLDLFSRLRSAA